jgi:hypothetical protein
MIMPESARFDKTERGVCVLGKGVESLCGSVEISAYRVRIKAVILPQQYSVAAFQNV